MLVTYCIALVFILSYVQPIIGQNKLILYVNLPKLLCFIMTNFFTLWRGMQAPNFILYSLLYILHSPLLCKTSDSLLHPLHYLQG